MNFILNHFSFKRKKAFLFFIVCFCILSSFSLQAQNQKVTLRVNDTPLEDVLNQIENQTGMHFLYSNKIVNINRKVSVNFDQKSLSDILNKLFEDQNVSYTINEDQIVLNHKAVNQKITKVVSGTVKDVLGEPIIGANILIKGTSDGGITDLTGKFSMNVPENAVLSISFIGYVTQEIHVAGKTDLQIQLLEDNQSLEEVVVVGYGVQKKVNLTGAVTSVKMEDILGDRPVTSVQDALQGAVPGLMISRSSGTPGESLDMNIRGVNSINGGSPLVLVDGVPLPIDLVNPNDIESISILKDASSAAIYGARAAFGVILVTTKQAKKEQKMQLNYSDNIAFTRPTSLPEKASPLETVQAYKDMGYTTYWTGQNIDTWLDMIRDYGANPGSYPGIYEEIEGIRYPVKETNMFKNMMSKSGFKQNHNLSVSGGSEKMAYRLSFGYLNEDGILITDKDSYKRYNVSSFLTADATSWLTAQLDIKYANSIRSTPQTDIPYGLWGRPLNNPSYHISGTTTELDGVTYPLMTSENAILNCSPVKRYTSDMRILGRVILTPLKGLKITGEYSFDRKDVQIKDYNKQFTSVDGMQYLIRTAPQYGSYEVTKENTNYHAINIFATYNYTLMNDHNFQAMVGFNQEDSYFDKLYSKRFDMINSELPSISQGTGDLKSEDKFTAFSLRGIFFRFNYDYQNKYLLEVNGRYDGSSKFPKNDRFGFFPSVSLGWRVTEEAFMKDFQSVLSNLKLRGSWGNVGNQNIDPYAFIPIMASEYPNWLVNGDKILTLKVPGLVSSSFTWEKVATTDIGVDLGLLSNRLSATFDWYQRDTKDMLAAGMELPSVLGSAAPKQNVADLRSKGWELSLGWTDKIDQVTYSLGFNIYDSKTKITKFNNEVGLLTDKDNKALYRIDKELGEIWGYTTDRLYTEDDFTADGNLKEGIARVKGVNPKPGDVLYVDRNGDGIIDNGTNTFDNSGDMTIIGNDKRRYQYSFNFGVGWKGIDVSAFFQGVGKRDLWAMNDLLWPHNGEFSAAIYKNQLDYWTSERTNSYYPRLYQAAAGNTAANQKVQTRYLQNGAYLRLQNVTVSYTLPKSICQKISFQNIKVFFSGENLITWDHLPSATGLDPETVRVNDNDTKNVLTWTYPFMKTFSFGINVTL